MRNLFLVLGISGACIAMSACTTTSTSPQQVASAPSTKIGTTKGEDENGDEIICRRDYETGSRVKFTEVCGTQEEWDIMDRETRDFMKDATGQRAASNSR